MATVSYLYTDDTAFDHSFSLGTLSNGLLKISVSGSAATPAIAVASDSTTNHDYVAGSKFLAQIAAVDPAMRAIVVSNGTDWAALAPSAVGDVLTMGGGNTIVFQTPLNSVGISSTDLSVAGSPLTSNGSITLNLNTVTTDKGGTGLTSFTHGDVPYYASGSALSKLSIGTANSVMFSDGGTPQWTSGSPSSGQAFFYNGSSPAWGTLTTAGGGTGLISYTAGDLPYYASGTALSKLAVGGSGNLLSSTGSAPTWIANTFVSAVNSGGAPTCGQAVIAATTTSITVNTTAVHTGSIILVSIGSISGAATLANGPVGVTAIVDGVSFTISCAVVIPGASSLNVNWLIAKS